MRLTCSRILFLSALLVGAVSPLFAQAHWAVTNTFHIGGEGGWDYVTVDAPHHRFFVTRSTHTQAIDENSGTVLADIPGQNRSHGVALVPKLGRGFITDGGGTGAILVFDLNTYKVLGRITTMPDSDGIIYDPGTDLVLAVSGDGNALMAFHPNIDPNSGSVGSPIQLGGSPEFLAADGAGKLYINLPDKNQVAVVDLHTRRVLTRWPVAPGGEPTSMAIDAAHHHLFVGCRRPARLIVMNTQNGKIEAALPIGSGTDAMRFSDGQVFVSCGDGSLTIAGESGGKFAVEQTVKTASGARTMGIDGMAHKIFLPTAQTVPGPAGRRPAMKPGTFQIVVVSAQ
jgi:DNA-binding beta-propeller fold protein YncE